MQNALFKLIKNHKMGKPKHSKCVSLCDCKVCMWQSAGPARSHQVSKETQIPADHFFFFGWVTLNVFSLLQEHG